MRRVVWDLQFIKDRTEVSRDTGCWLWKMQTSPGGYGLAGQHGKVRKAHRIAWVAARGPIPDGLHVCHRCDVRRCCNPDHLFLGTNLDNTLDKVAKGRQLKGSEAPSAKLTEADASIIKMLLGLGVRVSRLAALYEVSQPTISHIKRGSTWGHVRCAAQLRCLTYDGGRHG